ncbi:hypothetical protein NMG60_11031722 [Bertholletia excelsa]
MESNIPTQKHKKNSSSDPFVGIFTRSKSQIYLHLNRSGCVRSDTTRKRHYHFNLHASQPLPRKRRVLGQQGEASDIDSISHISVKDLRARRVFSPASIIEAECGSNRGIKVFDLEIDSVFESSNLPKPVSGRAKSSGMDEEFEKFNLGFCCVSENLDNEKPSCQSESHREPVRNDSEDKLHEESIRERGESGKCQAHFEDGNGRIESLIEECIQMTPPDAKISTKPKLDKNDDNVENIDHNLNGSVCRRDDRGFDSNSSIEQRKEPVHRIKLNSCTRRKVFKAPSSFSFRRMLPLLMDIAKDDPDADLFSKPEEKYNRRTKEDISLKAEDHIPKQPVEDCICTNGGIAYGKHYDNSNRKDDSASKSKLILNPCSRQKVFRTPGSFSYRRLLPYLTDSKTDDSHGSLEFLDDTRCGQSPKTENLLKKKTDLLVLASHNQEISTDAAITDTSPLDHCIKPPPDTKALDKISSNYQLTSTSTEDPVELEMKFDSQKECVSQVKQDMTNDTRSLESSPDDVRSCVAARAVSLCSPSNNEALHTESALVLSHCVHSSSQDDITVLQKGHFKEVKSSEAAKLGQKLSQVEAINPFRVPVDGLARGILKRNPRGCRGMCNCLNCASFHLHAERAFEFSRNQMQDTAEMTLELIKELSNLRNMLESSSIDLNGQSILYPDQVKEACTKALRAEEMAKCRLRQMNFDVNIHCRSMSLHRPRVSFANNVEEIVIPKEDLPSR